MADEAVVKRLGDGLVWAYSEGAVDPADIPEGVHAVPVCGNPHEYISELGGDRRQLGRLVRRIVDDHLRHGDGSGELSARQALDRLADRLDPERAEVERELAHLR